MIRRLVVLLLVIFGLVFVAGPVAVALLAIERNPTVASMPKPTAEELARAGRLLGVYMRALLGIEQGAVLTVSARDINNLIAYAASGNDRVAAKAELSPAGVAVVGTLKLPATPLGEFVNASVGIAPSQDGFKLTHVRLGTIEVPGLLATPALRLALDWALGDGYGSAAIAAVRSVTVQGDTATARLAPTPQLAARLKERMATAFKELVRPPAPETVRAYYARILEVMSAPNATAFATYLGAVLRLAQERAGDPVVENRAAILALAMFFGDGRFERFIGAVRTGALDTARSRVRLASVSLSGRHDLVQHFTISAGLVLISASGLAWTIGELKEIQDSAPRGSGFSFSDVAADRTGIRLAETATSGAAAARRLQALLAGNPAEELFFPRVVDLPDDMPAAEFGRRFGGGVGSPAYDTMLREIDRRIAERPAYRGG
jgi:hypothetical protein